MPLAGASAAPAMDGDRGCATFTHCYNASLFAQRVTTDSPGSASPAYPSFEYNRAHQSQKTRFCCSSCTCLAVAHRAHRAHLAHLAHLTSCTGLSTWGHLPARSQALSRGGRA